jgi:uncharacterized protein (TIGR00299 family) protein
MVRPPSAVVTFDRHDGPPTTTGREHWPETRPVGDTWKMACRVLYFDCFSGISGDMVLGALLDAGLPLAELTSALGSLALSGYDVTAERVLRAGVSATKFNVHEHGGQRTPDEGHHDHPHEHADAAHHTHDEERHHAHHHAHRSLPEIFSLIETSALSPAARDRAKALFHRLADAEAAIHQMPIEQVHLHEVGALDSIIDIVGAVFAMEWAAADRIVCSPLNVGGGMVQSAHGWFPVPAPATLTLLGNAPIYSGVIKKELVTPTGALLATGYATTFGPIPAMTVERVGYGAGTRDTAGTPNVLRVLIGESAETVTGDRVAVIECEIDDMNPQLFGTAMERLYAAGALEVFYVPVQMKKNRPGTLLTVIGPPARRAALADVVFRETTTIGLRYSEVERECLRRETRSVPTSLGPIRFKLAWRDGRIVNAAPEFDDCAAIARAQQLSVKDVQAVALQAYGQPGQTPT